MMCYMKQNEIDKVVISFKKRSKVYISGWFLKECSSNTDE